MKKLSFLFLSFYLALTNLFAQDIVFTFNAKDASNTIDSIKATKIETGETAFVEGSNTINMSSFTTGTKLSPKNPEEISVYPNPFENVTHLKFYSNQNDNIKVSLINAAGQVVAEKKQNVTSGIHQFNVTTKNNGLYILNVAGNKKRFSQKIISTNNNQYPDKIEYSGYSSMSLKEKSAKTEEGELVHFSVYSGDNITNIADSPKDSKIYEVEFFECKDAEGKSYPIVQIGEQWWMAENLEYLPDVNFSTEESKTEQLYYVYGVNDTIISKAKVTQEFKIYGVLYNWPAAMSSCPNGWHLPSNEEWNKLINYLGGEHLAGGKLKDVGAKHWNSASTGTTNETGFTALPGGYRGYGGNFFNLGSHGVWWAVTEHSTGFAYKRDMNYSHDTVISSNAGKEMGFSVRCVKD